MTVNNIYLLPFKKKCVGILGIIFPLPNRKKTFISNIRSLLEFCFSVFIMIYLLLFIFTPYSVSVNACESEYFSEKKQFKCEDVDVKIVESLPVFLIVSLSFNEDVLGVNSFFNTIFINKNSVEKFNQKISDILKHELEHSNQRIELGLIGFYLTPKWLIEGSADYIRGKPTIGYCRGIASWGDGSSKQFYFESWAKVFYLLQFQGVSYDELYKNDIILQVSDNEIKTKLADFFCLNEESAYDNSAHNFNIR